VPYAHGVRRTPARSGDGARQTAPWSLPPAIAAAALTVVAATLLACRGAPGIPTLTWYVNPDNGTQARLASRCAAESGGRYRIRVESLPRDATQQREQLVRRLAARDRSIDLMNLDIPFVPEFARAGFLLRFTASQARRLTEGALAGPVEAATWNGELVAAPLWANTQLLWYRRSVALRAGLDPAARPVTWEEIIEAAERTGTTVEVQGGRYEGYLVWINALVASAGGEILLDPAAGRDARPGLDSPAGRRAAAIIHRLATSRAADPALSTSDEEATRAAFQGGQGGFLVNWPYVYGAAREAVAAGALGRAVFEDIGWARYPRVDPGRESRPPLGGIALGIGAFSAHPDLAAEAALCIASPRSQTEYMLSAQTPVSWAGAYADPAVRRLFPMADLIRDSIAASAPRPRTPYYNDVSAAVVRAFHPEDGVDPARTPARAAKLVVDVLHDRVLL
jgi:multiple sugar transport system substrate-binding protein